MFNALRCKPWHLLWIPSISVCLWSLLLWCTYYFLFNDLFGFLTFFLNLLSGFIHYTVQYSLMDKRSEQTGLCETWWVWLGLISTTCGGSPCLKDPLPTDQTTDWTTWYPDLAETTTQSLHTSLPAICPLWNHIRSRNCWLFSLN